MRLRPGKLLFWMICLDLIALCVLVLSESGRTRKMPSGNFRIQPQTASEGNFRAQARTAQDGDFAVQEGEAAKETESADRVHKKIALTFDDGPHPRYTRQLLEGLRERNVRVTFFVIGNSAQTYPELIREMKKDGHLIGNHTYTHMQLTRGNGNRFVEELIKTDELILELTGEHTEFVRPPFGIWNREYEKTLNMIPVFWTVDPLDWCCKDASAVASRVLQKADENGIILLHDVYESSVRAALDIIDALTAQGYEFVTVDEIILD